MTQPDRNPGPDAPRGAPARRGWRGAFAGLPPAGAAGLALIAAVSLAVAGLQIARVQMHDFDRWKGGGMGMFADIALRHAEIRATPAAAEAAGFGAAAETPGAGLEIAAPELAREIRLARNFPGPRQMDALCARLLATSYEVEAGDGGGAARLRATARGDAARLDAMQIAIWDVGFDAGTNVAAPVLLRRKACAR